MTEIHQMILYKKEENYVPRKTRIHPCADLVFIVEYLISEDSWDNDRLAEQDCFLLCLEMNGKWSQP